MGNILDEINPVLPSKIWYTTNSTKGYNGFFLASPMTKISDDAEGFINAVTRYDWVANSAAISTNFKPTLALAASNLAAADLIAYDMSGYPSRAAAESQINLLYDRAVRLIEALKDEKVKTKMGASNQ